MDGNRHGLHAEPVIQEVTVRRGNGAKRTTVKNGTIYEQKFGYRKYDKITFEATMIGAGYFYTVMHEGAESDLSSLLPLIVK